MRTFISKFKVLDMRYSCSMATLCLMLLCVSGTATGFSTAACPLAPPDTTSPRASLRTFLDEMNTAVVRYQAGQNEEAKKHAGRAIRCFNLGVEPPAIRHVLGFYSALYLKETLDRIEIPPLEQVPDAKASEIEKSSLWTIPGTEITIAAVKDASGVERFLFTPETVTNAESFYNTVKLLPYKPGCVGAMYEQFNLSAGPLIPKTLTERLPQWAKSRMFGQAVWKWTGLALFLLVGMTSIFFIHWHGSRVLTLLEQKIGGDLTNYVGALILPISLILFAHIGLWFIVHVLHFLQADTYIPMAFLFLSISYFGTIWLIAAFLNRAAALVIAAGGFESGGMHSPLIRFCFNVVTVVVVVITALSLGARLGLPTYSLVAGLGIGGLAVALAGRETLSNVIGTITILLDQPFKLGDFIVPGEKDRGTVTEIGLRSTRIKTTDGILVSIPNSSVANMKIINESAPVSEARIRVSVAAACGSPEEKVDEALLCACRQCEYVTVDQTPSVRLVRFGDSAVEFELLVWIARPEYRGRATNQLIGHLC